MVRHPPGRDVALVLVACEASGDDQFLLTLPETLRVAGDGLPLSTKAILQLTGADLGGIVRAPPAGVLNPPVRQFAILIIGSHNLMAF